MLTMVTAERTQSGILLLPLTDSSAGYAVQEIKGLDPGKATLVSTSRANQDGGDLHNSRREPRNITMKLGLKPDYVSTSVASLRANLYRWFMPKSIITFSLYSDDVLFGITNAVVESCENDMFSSDPQVDISLLCYDPDFYAPDPVVLQSSTVNDTTSQIINYNGTSETGILFTIVFPDAAGGIWLYNTSPDGTTGVIQIQGAFVANDILKIDTNNGRKSVTLIRGGSVFPSLYFLDSRSTWITLEQGENIFRAYLPGNPVDFTLEYTPKYGGF